MESKIIYIVFVLICALFSCNGQEYRKDQTTSKVIGHQLEHTEDDRISQVVRMMYQDSRGLLWFGTQNGVFWYDGDTLQNLTSIKNEYNQGVTIRDIAEDNAGNIWFGHTDGLSCFTGDTVLNYYVSHGLRHHDVWSVACDKQGRIWAGTYDGISIYDGTAFTGYSLPEGIKDSERGVSGKRMVHNIQRDNDHNLWLSTNAGLFFKKDVMLHSINEIHGIKTPFINEILQDDKDDIWIATKTDLYLLKEDHLLNITNNTIPIGKGIGAMEQDVEGNIWFVANQHDLYRYDGVTITEIPKKDNDNRPVIFDIFRDQEDLLWFVGFGGAYRLENDTFIHITKNGPW